MRANVITNWQSLISFIRYCVMGLAQRTKYSVQRRDRYTQYNTQYRQSIVEYAWCAYAKKIGEHLIVFINRHQLSQRSFRDLVAQPKRNEEMR